jgi:hypothetical protein
VAEAEYASVFGGGQVLVELTLTLTNLGHPQQSPSLLFVNNECAIGLATSSARPKKPKSIDMRLDWLKERASQQFFRLIFFPGLIKNLADFFTKILPVYRHIAALPFLHGTPYPTSLAPPPSPSHPIHTIAPVVAMQSSTGTPHHSLPLTSPHFVLPSLSLLFFTHRV